MAAVSVGDAALLRSHAHRINYILNAVPLVQVATARINQVTFAYPLAEFVVDGTSSGWLTDVKVGQAFSIGSTAGGTDITWGVVRKAPTSNTFYMDGKSLGDSGYARDIRSGLADNQYLTVYSFRPMWGLLSAIRSGIFYKQFDVAYSDQGSNPPPVCRIGKHRQAWVNTTTNKAIFDFTEDGFAWGTKTISNYSWDLDGGSLVSGSLTGATLTAEFDPGFYVVSCTITDSGGKTHTAFRYVWANTRTGSTAPFGALHAWQVSGDQQDVVGRSLDLTVYGNFMESDLYPGQAFLLTEEAWFNNQQLSDDSVRVSNALLYANDRSITRTRSTPSVSMHLSSPLALAKTIPAATQQINETAVPTDWTQVTSALSHPPGAAWYILQHHCPTLLAGHDFMFNTALKTLRKKSFVMQANSIGGQIDQIAEMIPGTAGNRSDGTLKLAMNPMVLNNTDRNALENKFSWEAGDIIPPLTYPARYLPPIGLHKGYAFSYDGGAEATPYASQAPGVAQGQGVGKAEATYIVSASGGQTRVNEVNGHLLAQEAARTPEFGFVTDRNLDIAEPADADVWHTSDVPADYDPLGEGWTNKRMIPKRISRTYRRGVKEVRIDWQPETFGQPGITIPVERSGAGNWIFDGWNFQLPVEFDPKFADAFALAWDDNGLLGRTLNFNGSEPHWESLMDGLDGLVNDVALDYRSEFFASGVGNLGVWAVTTEGTALRIYYAPDVRTSVPVWTLQKTYTMNDSTVVTGARIASSKTSAAFLIVAWKTQTGVQFGRSTNGGTSWGSATQVGSAITDIDANENADIGLAVDGVKQLVTAPDGTGKYFLYLATTTGGSFSVVTDAPDSAKPYPLVVVDGEGRAYTKSYPSTLTSTNINVTFDSGGTAGYVTPNSYIPNATIAIISSGGFSGNGIRKTITPIYAFTTQEMGIEGDFLDIVDVTDAGFRYKINPNSGSFVSGYPNTYAELQYLDISNNILRTATFAVTIDNAWHSISESVAVSGCRYVVARIYAEIYTFDPTSMTITLDDIVATRSATLYRISSYASTPTWTDITPSGHEPEYPFAVAIDPLNLQHMVMTANGFTPKLYSTLNRGSAWTDEGETGLTYRGVKLLGDQIVLFGTAAIDYSTDGGASFVSKLGDWSSSMGAMGTFRGMWCII